MWKNEVNRHGMEDASLKRVVWKFTRSRVLVNIVLYLTSLVFGFMGPVMHELIDIFHKIIGNLNLEK